MTEKPRNPGRKQVSSWFKPGHSGNPSGLQKGSRRRVSKLLDMIGDENSQAVLNAVIAKAIKGHTASADLVLRHAWPLRKGAPVKIDGMPRIATLADVNPALEKIVSAMCDAELSPDEAQAVAAVIEVQRKSLESVDLEIRVRALESRGVPT